MRKFLFITIVLMILGCSRPQNNIQLFDLDGNEHTLEKNNYVIMFLVTDCPLALNYTKEFQELSDSFSSANLIFKAVVAGNQYTKNEINNYTQKSGLNMPIWIDKDFVWCKKLNVTVSPSFFLVDSSNQILYRGALDNRMTDLGTPKRIISTYYLKEAIRSWQSVRAIAIKSAQPIGCFIEYN